MIGDVSRRITNHELPNQGNEVQKHHWKLDLPDDSGRKSERLELPDDSGKQFQQCRFSDNANEQQHIKNGKLEPDQIYERNGYLYQTDTRGRIVSAEGQLHMKSRTDRLPIADSMENIGRGDQRANDERGHLIGDQFDGSNQLDNIVPMSRTLNHGDYLSLERNLADAVKDGKKTYLKVEPRYINESARPFAFKVTFHIDEEKFIRFFLNEEADKHAE